MIFITGKLNGSESICKLNSKNFYEQKQMTSDDYLIICGDFKLLYNNSAEEKRLLKFLESRAFTILLVEGPNENFDLLNDCKEISFCNNPIQMIARNVFRLKRGYIYNIEGFKILTLGGGVPEDKAIKLPHSNYWFEALPSKDDIKRCISSIKENNYKVDYIITSDSPNSFKEKFCESEGLSEYGSFLDRIKNSVTFKKWYCGLGKDIVTNRFICLNNYFYKLGDDRPLTHNQNKRKE